MIVVFTYHYAAWSKLYFDIECIKKNIFLNVSSLTSVKS